MPVLAERSIRRFFSLNISHRFGPRLALKPPAAGGFSVLPRLQGVRHYRKWRLGGPITRTQPTGLIRPVRRPGKALVPPYLDCVCFVCTADIHHQINAGIGSQPRAVDRALDQLVLLTPLPQPPVPIDLIGGHLQYFRYRVVTPPTGVSAVGMQRSRTRSRKRISPASDCAHRAQADEHAARNILRAGRAQHAQAA